MTHPSCLTRKEVILIIPVTVPVQIGRVLPSLAVRKIVSLQLLRNPAWTHQTWCREFKRAATRTWSLRWDTNPATCLWVPEESSTTFVRRVLLDSNCAMATCMSCMHVDASRNDGIEGPCRSIDSPALHSSFSQLSSNAQRHATLEEPAWPWPTKYHLHLQNCIMHTHVPGENKQWR